MIKIGKYTLKRLDKYNWVITEGRKSRKTGEIVDVVLSYNKSIISAIESILLMVGKKDSNKTEYLDELKAIHEDIRSAAKELNDVVEKKKEYVVKEFDINDDSEMYL